MASFEKIIFYSYPKLEKVVRVIDANFKKKILESKCDFSSALFQCEELIKLTNAKVALLKVKRVIEKILSDLGSLAPFVKYKYFGIKNSETAFIDSTKRGYYRIQDKIAKKLKLKLELLGINQDWFDQNLKHLTYIKEVARRVEVRELQAERAKIAQSFSSFDKNVKKIG
jgi:hypothetical protein